MRLIGFRDTCVIKRESGRDEWDNPAFESVYEGKCLYEEGGSYYSSQIFVKSPNVFIPKIDKLVQVNDTISITTEYGRKVEGIAKAVRDINMPTVAFKELTRIELKQAKDE